MANLNRCTFIGNLTRDPEVRYMPNGDAVANCSIAVNESWKDKSGEKQERVEYVNLVFYRKLAEIVGEYLKKGAPIYVEGKLSTRKWQDKNTGADRYTTEIIANEMQMLGSKGERKEPLVPGLPNVDRIGSRAHAEAARRDQEFFDDDIPFN